METHKYLGFSADSQALMQVQDQINGLTPFFSSVLDVYAMLQNPLYDRLNKIKIDYNSGGFFCLYDQSIVLSAKSYPADYEILIPEISSPKVYN